MKRKYENLLADKDLQRWYDNLAARSIITAGVYLRGLGLYCTLNHTTPKEILQNAGGKKFKDDFTDFVRRLEKEGKAGSYIGRFKKVIISWVSYNDIDIELKVNIAGESDTPTLRDERVPTKEELAKIIRKASTRARVAIALIAFSGLRPESLGDYVGTDGIRLGDLKEAKISSDGITFEKTPSILIVRRNLSKARHQYFSFISTEAAKYITEYFEERVKKGEKLSEQSPLLQFDARGVKKNSLLRTTLVTRDIKEAILAAQFSWRPYVLRAYADTAFDIAESKGLLSHRWRQFFMAHKGDIEARYSTNKGRLPPNMIEEMREAYKRCEPLLSTEKQQEASEEKIKQTFKEQLLLVAGFKKEEVEKMDLNSISDEDLQQTVRQKLLGAMANNGNKQKVVPISQVRDLIPQGWEYVAQLPTGEAIVKLPT